MAKQKKGQAKKDTNLADPKDVIVVENDIIECEDGKKIEVTPELKTLHNNQVYKIKAGMWDIMEGLITISETRSFTAEGFNNMTDFINNSPNLPLRGRQMEKYLATGKKFLLEGQPHSSAVKVNSINKLYLVSTLESKALTEFLDTGRLKLADGSEVTAEEINDMTTKQFKAELDFLKGRVDKERGALIEELNKESKAKQALEKKVEGDKGELDKLKRENKMLKADSKLKDERLASALAGGALVERVEDVRAITREFQKATDIFINKVRHISGNEENYEVLAAALAGVQSASTDLQSAGNSLQGKIETIGGE